MDFNELINNSIEESKSEKGRPRKEEVFDYRYRRAQAKAIKNSNDFPQEIVERVRGEVVGEEEETEQKIEMYRETAFSVLEQFIIDNPERVKKNVATWNIDLYFQIRKHIPKPPYDNIQLLNGLYQVYCEICARVGAVASYYGFSFFSGIPCSTLMDWKNGRNLTPKHTDMLKKWDDATSGALFEKLYNGNTNTIGTIFGLKQRGYLEGQYYRPENVETAHNIDDLPIFAIEDHQENP